ncbi:hypothetical protein L195_g041801 [Trifolium pratense]|uniref:Uncharacterized protein n=1 Tax=Trifolium pratense TaxID=57577 RepID=A0A2K3M4K8_TRIPR|nr:hypothetical protein L195_g041801 [Trifolium pratense]
MILLTKHTSVIILLLIVLLSFTSNLNKVSAASGGAAGGSFFDSDSDSSSSSDSFTSDSYSEYANDRHHHVYDSPSHDRVELPSGPILFFMVFTVGMSIVSASGDPSIWDPEGGEISPPEWDEEIWGWRLCPRTFY